MAFNLLALEQFEIQLIDGDRGKNYPKQHDFKDAGYCLFLSAKNVTAQGFEFEQQTYITKEKDHQLRAGKLQTNDIVLTTRGTIGNLAFYDKSIPFEHIRINSGMIILRANVERWNSQLLYFILTSDMVRQQIAALTSGSAVPQLPARDIKKFLLPDIPRERQDSIARQLSVLNEKITLNRQINQTLEQMAQALFKSWFVDFDPVVDNALDAGFFEQNSDLPEELLRRAEQRKAVRQRPDFKPLPVETRQLFPAAFEECEELSLGLSGWVPKGWQHGTLANVTGILNGFAFKSNEFKDDGIGVIKIKNINSDRHIDIFDVQRVGCDTSDKVSKFTIGDGDLLMAMTGATVGKFGMLVSEVDELYLLNQRVAKFEFEQWKLPFVYCVLNRSVTESYILNAAQGSAQPNISASGILSLPMVVPDLKLQSEFCLMVGHFFSKMIWLQKECFALVKLRDTLLPKLISGELRLNDDGTLASGNTDC